MDLENETKLKCRNKKIIIAYICIIILNCAMVCLVIEFNRSPLYNQYYHYFGGRNLDVKLIKNRNVKNYIYNTFSDMTKEVDNLTQTANPKSKYENNSNNKLKQKLPASKILLKVDSSDLHSNKLLTKQYENTISDELSLKEIIFITDVNKKFYNRLNLYAWRDLNSQYVEIFKGVIGFPFNPMMKDYATNLSITRELKYSHGKRIFGYITTPETGDYKLAISSSHHSEVWLSSNHNPTLANNVASVGSKADKQPLSTEINSITQLNSQQSKIIRLNENQLYYLELMHACTNKNSHLQLFWAKEDKNSNKSNDEFKIIGSEYLVLHHLYMDDKLIAESRAHDIVWPMHKQTINNTYSNPDHRIEMINLPALKAGFLRGAIEDCNPIPQNERVHSVGRYSGYKEIRMYTLYPKDGTEHYDDKGNHSPWMYEKAAEQLIKILKKQLKNKNLNFVLDEVLNIEKIHYTVSQGSRILIEAKVRLDEKDNTIYRMSEYLYLPKDSSTFCYLPDFQWKRNAFIYLGISNKNQGYWVRHTIENLERVQKELNDENWGLIITDFESTDMDVLALLTRSTLRHWKYIKLQGVFSRSHGVNAFLNEMGGDGDMIGFSTDLQIDIPLNYIDIIRTHTIQGLAITAPALMRLRAGRFYLNPYGFWEYLGYGQIGMYLKDWYEIGGMNTQDFGNKWGGEDWEFIDRCVAGGIEVQRMLIRQCFHYFHTKKGTWDSKDTLSTKYFT